MYIALLLLFYACYVSHNKWNKIKQTSALKAFTSELIVLGIYMLLFHAVGAELFVTILNKKFHPIQIDIDHQKYIPKDKWSVMQVL